MSGTTGAAVTAATGSAIEEIAALLNLILIRQSRQLTLELAIMTTLDTLTTDVAALKADADAASALIASLVAEVADLKAQLATAGTGGAEAAAALAALPLLDEGVTAADAELKAAIASGTVTTPAGPITTGDGTPISTSAPAP